jgi:hypothetical protein
MAKVAALIGSNVGVEKCIKQKTCDDRRSNTHVWPSPNRSSASFEEH